MAGIFLLQLLPRMVVDGRLPPHQAIYGQAVYRVQWAIRVLIYRITLLGIHLDFRMWVLVSLNNLDKDLSVISEQELSVE
jgi:hypothetical protein